MNRKQEWVIRVAGVLLAIVSAGYGTDNDEPFWQFVVPILMVTAIVFLAVRTKPKGDASRSALRSRGASSVLDDIEALAALRSQGVLSEAEFVQLKERVVRVASGDGVTTKSASAASPPAAMA